MVTFAQWYESVAKYVEPRDHLQWMEAAWNAALAQPEPEPVAWRYQNARGLYRYVGHRPGWRNFADEYSILNPIPLYASPPQRKPLTEREIRRLWDKACRTVTVQGGGNDVQVFADYLQRAHGIGG